MAELKVGDVLEGRYRIDHPIARGGMSTVYRCVDLRLGRAVAAKVMDDQHRDDPVFRQRFRREARAMAQLSHPNLVNVYDFNSEGEHIFLVMELITGGTLRELLAERGPMPPHAATAVMRAVLTGLSVVHQEGLVHRDIKPDNVLINGNHQVKLADFGLVRATDGATATTSQIVGTVAYLSPEQVDGSTITPASDVYSAGIVLYELLTGETPFEGETPLQRAYDRLERTVPAPSSRIEGVPPLFDALVASATALNPADRFKDAGEFLVALDDIAEELALPSFRVPVPKNSAAHRAAAVPTSTTDVLPPVSSMDATNVLPMIPNEDSPQDASETAVLSPYVDPQAPQETSQLEAAQLPPEQPAPIPQAVPVPPAAPAPQMPVTIPPRRPVSNRSKLKTAAWLIFITLIVGAVAVGGWWFGSGRYGEIPQVYGLSQTEAVAVVEEAGFDPSTRFVFNDDVPRDHIVGSEPHEGERQVRGQTVTILVSQGKPTVPAFPDDRSVETFRSEASKRTLTITFGDGVFSDDIPEGKIVESHPAPGETVPVNSAIKIETSRGPAPVNVPDVRGMEADKARELLESTGLKVGDTTHDFYHDVENGKVNATIPSAGTELAKGTEVTLQVSTALKVPEVAGQTVKDAIKTLNDAGLTVNDHVREEGTTSDRADRVLNVDPGSGALVDPAHPTVTLVLPEKVLVPGVMTKTVKEAADVLSKVGLGVTAEGNANARVFLQDPSPGTSVAPGTTVTLKGIGPGWNREDDNHYRRKPQDNGVRHHGRR